MVLIFILILACIFGFTEQHEQHYFLHYVKYNYKFKRLERIKNTVNTCSIWTTFEQINYVSHN